MKNFWRVIYNLFVIPTLYALLHLLSFFNGKIKKGISERKHLFEKLILGLISLDKNKKLVWFHASSMGEFEQAKPIIQQLKSDTDVNVIATFYSPSGYENSLNYPYANIISYLPFDTKALSKRFISLVHPDVAVMMRYDIWPNIVWTLSENNIPCYIVDATMRQNSQRKLPGAMSFHKSLYKNITKILTVSESDVKSFGDFEISDDKLLAVGDTRFDRVYQKSLAAKEKKLFRENFFENKTVMVAGSSWEADEEVFLSAFVKLTRYQTDAVLILVPHEPSIARLEKLENYLHGKISSIRFSFLNEYKGERIIIVDSIGILLTLYYYADMAYVGGSFKQGIHNVLEPAVYGIPVFFGPKIENSQEAKKMVSLGASQVVRNKKEAYRLMRSLFADAALREKMGCIASSYVEENLGATEKILSEIRKNL